MKFNICDGRGDSCPQIRDGSLQAGPHVLDMHGELAGLAGSDGAQTRLLIDTRQLAIQIAEQPYGGGPVQSHTATCRYMVLASMTGHW